MTVPMAAWRVTYTPGNWLVLSGPTMLVVMLPAPARMSGLVNRLWTDVVSASSVNGLLELLNAYGLESMPDFAAFFWDDAGLHGLARGAIKVTDTDTGELAVDGERAVTWREENLGTARRLRIDMEPVDQEEVLQLPLLVGAVSASAIYLTTHDDEVVRFPERDAPAPEQTVAGAPEEDQAAAVPPAARRSSAEDESHLDAPTDPDAIGTGELAFTPHEDTPASMSSASTPPASAPEPPVPPAPGSEAPTQALPPAPAPSAPTAPPAGPVVVPGAFTQAEEPQEEGTIFSTGLAATHKPAADAEVQSDPQVLAVPCARGHANAPGSRHCRLCNSPVDSSSPRLIRRPALAGVHSNQGEFADILNGVLIGRSPDPSKAPAGSHLMRVPSPSSDISRSHLLVTPRDWSIIVTDLNSTNGTTVMPVGEQPFVLANGDSVQVELGTVLDLGDGVSLRIEPPRG